jgi:hypothetical protein
MFGQTFFLWKTYGGCFTVFIVYILDVSHKKRFSTFFLSGCRMRKLGPRKKECWFFRQAFKKYCFLQTIICRNHLVYQFAVKIFCVFKHFCSTILCLFFIFYKRVISGVIWTILHDEVVHNIYNALYKFSLRMLYSLWEIEKLYCCMIFGLKFLYFFQFYNYILHYSVVISSDDDYFCFISGNLTLFFFWKGSVFCPYFCVYWLFLAFSSPVLLILLEYIRHIQRCTTLCNFFHWSLRIGVIAWFILMTQIFFGFLNFLKQIDANAFWKKLSKMNWSQVSIECKR